MEEGGAPGSYLPAVERQQAVVRGVVSEVALPAEEQGPGELEEAEEVKPPEQPAWGQAASLVSMEEERKEQCGQEL